MMEKLEDLLRRLERERGEADRLYNDALTTLDGALQQIPPMPDPPPPYDERQITPINLGWNILPGGPPPVDHSLTGRLRGFIWRLVGPSIEQQHRFNAALVEHLNRNTAVHREAAQAIETLIATLRQHVEGLVAFQHRLIQYLQTITLYVDTKDRSVAGQAQVLNAAIAALTDDWLKRWESLTSREQRISAHVAAVDDLRASVGIAQQTALMLKREVQRLLDGPGPRVSGAPPQSLDLDAFKYVGFEDAFRGSPDEIRSRLAAYVPLFTGRSDVLDLGCGRGEFLELLREHDIPARGLDLNHEMVEASRARGLDVAEGDALGYLDALNDASLGGVFAAQVVEHLEPAYLVRLLETAMHKLRPGGIIVLETINPACWTAFFESYIRDLTHIRPVHPETLEYLVRVSGFQQVSITYTSPIPNTARLQPAPAQASNEDSPLGSLTAVFDENVAKLNARMFTYQDYAVIGRK